MKRLVMTRELAHAAARDEANRSARRAGRLVWNEDDYNVFVREYDRLFPVEMELAQS